MANYTVDNLIITEVEYERRTWWPASLPLGRTVSEFKYTKAKALMFTTKDGKYTTGSPDPDDFSMWRETVEPRCPLGYSATDYVFGAMGGVELAISKLNQLIKEYHDCLHT